MQYAGQFWRVECRWASESVRGAPLVLPHLKKRWEYARLVPAQAVQTVSVLSGQLQLLGHSVAQLVAPPLHRRGGSHLHISLAASSEVQGRNEGRCVHTSYRPKTKPPDRLVKGVWWKVARHIDGLSLWLGRGGRRRWILMRQESETTDGMKERRK